MHKLHIIQRMMLQADGAGTGAGTGLPTAPDATASNANGANAGTDANTGVKTLTVKERVAELLRLPPAKRSDARTMRDILTFCSSFQFFSKFEESACRDILSAVEYRSCPANTVIFAQGDASREFYIVFHGESDKTTQTL